METKLWERRAWMVTCVLALLSHAGSLAGQDAPVEYFEGIHWFERRAGSTEPRILDGKLMVNRDEERVVFFSGYTNRFEAPFKKVKSLTYEFAKRPSNLTVPVSDKAKLFNRGPRHYLIFEYQDKGGYFQQEILELHKKTWSEVLKALEYATGLEVKRR